MTVRLNKLRSFLANDDGNATIWTVMLALPLLMCVGLIVDGGTQVQLAIDSQQVAASASRAAVNAISSETLLGQGLSVDTAKAEQAAREYISAAGMSGSVSVRGFVVDVHVEATAPARFLSLIGTSALTASGDASAQLIDGPTN